MAHTRPVTTFQEFYDELWAEAEAEGPQGVAEFAAWHLHFQLSSELADRRQTLGLSREQLAASTGIEEAEIKRIEGGEVTPTLPQLAALTRALGLEVQLTPRAGS